MSTKRKCAQQSHDIIDLTDMNLSPPAVFVSHQVEGNTNTFLTCTEVIDLTDNTSSLQTNLSSNSIISINSSTSDFEDTETCNKKRLHDKSMNIIDNCVDDKHNNNTSSLQTNLSSNSIISINSSTSEFENIETCNKKRIHDKSMNIIDNCVDDEHNNLKALTSRDVSEEVYNHLTKQSHFDLDVYSTNLSLISYVNSDPQISFTDLPLSKQQLQTSKKILKDIQIELLEKFLSVFDSIPKEILLRFPQFNVNTCERLRSLYDLVKDKVQQIDQKLCTNSD